MMRPSMRAGPVVLPILLLLAVPAEANGDARVNFLIKRLEKASDARGRMQAALMLGAADDPKAVTPLCGALDDPEEVVRVSAARALEQLGDHSAIECLRRSLGGAKGETRITVQHALTTLEKQKNRKPTLYVQLEPVIDNRTQPDPPSAQLAEARLRARLGRLGVVLAPADEDAKAARAVLKTRKLKGFQLNPKLASTPDGGIRLILLGMTYPERKLLGEVTIKAAGAPPADLLQALVPAALEEASRNFEWELHP
jgi:hypothetical protein